jgi:hypothetical protein
LAFHVKEARNEAGAIWKRKKDEGRFMTAKDGDMWCAPFQCDWCWFINLEKRTPRAGNLVDERLLGYIRRVNLDIMWSREAGTVDTTLTQLRKMIRLCKDLGMSNIDIPIGAWPVKDEVGFRLAIVMLRASQEKGRNDNNYVQFDSIRKLRSGFSNIYENSAIGHQTTLAFRGDKGKAYRYSTCETESRLFAKFVRGLESRMGRQVQSNVGLDHRILLAICRNYDKELADTSVEFERKRTIIMVGTYLMVCFGASLRGNEGLYLEGSTLCSMIDYGNSEEERANMLGHVCAPLLGRFKSEVGEDKHIAVMTNKSKSGLCFRLWMERLVWLLKKEKKDNVAGPAFCHRDGSMFRSHELDRELHKSLKIVQLERPDLLPEGIDIEKLYGTFRSCRRGSLTRATEEGIEGPDLDLINRWRKWESNRGGSPHMSMREHYLEIKLVLKRMLSYSKAL